MIQNLLTLYSLILLKPEELYIKLKFIEDKLLRTHRILVSICFSGSILILKSKLYIRDFILWAMLIVVIYFIIYISSSLLGNFFISHLKKIERFKQESFSNISQILVNIQKTLELGWLPFIFLIHFSILSVYFKAKIIFFLGIIIILVWKFIIWWKSLQFYLEIQEVKTVFILVYNIFLLIFFLFLHVIFFFTFVYYFISG